jgi:hypothetical protein
MAAVLHSRRELLRFTSKPFSLYTLRCKSKFTPYDVVFARNKFRYCILIRHAVVFSFIAPKMPHRRASACIGFTHTAHTISFQLRSPQFIHIGSQSAVEFSVANISATRHRGDSRVEPVDCSRRAQSNGMVGGRPLCKLRKRRSKNRWTALRVPQNTVEFGCRLLRRL